MSHAAVIERIEHGPGFVLVSGWLATARDEPWPEHARLRIGEWDTPLSRWFPRADLPQDDASLRFLTFREDLPWPEEGPVGLPVALYLDDPATPLAVAAPAAWSSFVPSGHLEVVSQAALSGWIFDPAIWHEGAEAILWLDGAPVAPLPLSVARPDILSGAALRGQALGFWIGPDELGRVFDSVGTVFDGAERRWSIVTSGVEIHAVSRSLPPISRGRLEGMRDGLVRGWAALEGHPDAAVTVMLSLGGIPIAAPRAGRRRDDLLSAGITSGFGGFAVPLRLDPTGTGAPVLEARVAGEGRPLLGSPMTLRGLVAPAAVGDRPWRGLARGRPRVSIIVPVYNAPEDLARCLASVVAGTHGAARLIVLDDASTDPRVADVLAPYRGCPGIEVHTNAFNLGFTATCNRGIELAGRDDVVLLNSDAVVPARWLEGLVAAAYSAPDIATATPLSDNAGPFSAPETGIANTLPPGLGVDDLSRLVAQASLATYPEVPTGHGFCLYLRRDAMNVIGQLDAAAFPRGYGEENDFCMRALRAGLRNLVDDRTYVCHRRSASFGAARAELLAEGRAVVDARYPEYRQLVRAFVTDEAMQGVRWRVRKAFTAARPPRPRVLFVISTETGGTPQTNLDLMRALEDRYEPWLLRSDGQALTLRRLLDGRLEEVSTHALSQPLAMAVHRSAEYDAFLAALLLRHAIELVHVRHLAWHGLDLSLIARALGIPVVLSLHDFYVACPTVKLLDGAFLYCGGRCAEGQGECRADLWPEEQSPPLRDRFLHRWREMMAPAMAACDAFVTTSPTARSILQDAYPDLREADFRIIAHGRSFAQFVPPGDGARGPGPLRVLVPGNISAAKGAALIRAMAERDGGRRVEFHVLGEPGPLVSMPGIVLHGTYERDSFVDLAAAIAPDLGAVLSIWPETYCHTLTELWAAGLPVFGLDLGAVGERIRAHGGGWLSASRDPDEVLAALSALDPAGEEMARRRTEVLAWQRGEGTARDAHAMAFDYDLLYREVGHRRRAFQADFEPPQAWLLADARHDPTGPVPAAMRNRPGGPVVFRPAILGSLPAMLSAGGVAGIALLCDTPDDDVVREVAALGTRHGVALALCPADGASRAAAGPAGPWLVLDAMEAAAAAQAQLAALRPPAAGVLCSARAG
jgi:GT2 family glycosyltransferase/glycosyltransferase involved in cell wall biosynthesis